MDASSYDRGEATTRRSSASCLLVR